MTPALSCLHADMPCWVHSPHLTHCDYACLLQTWLIVPFSGKPISRWLWEWITPAYRRVAIHPHTRTHRLLQSPQRFRVTKCFTHAQEGNRAGRYVQRSLLVQTNVYCFGWIPGDYYFYFRALGYTGSILVLSPASYVKTHFNGWTHLTSVQVYLCSNRGLSLGAFQTLTWPRPLS